MEEVNVTNFSYYLLSVGGLARESGFSLIFSNISFLKHWPWILSEIAFAHLM